MFERGGARGREPIVEAARERARFAVTRRVRVLARLVARDELEHPQRQHAARGRAQRIGRVERERAPGRLRGQEKEPVQMRLPARLQQREQRAERLADAGGRLREQHTAVARGAVRGDREFALTAAKARMRKRERAQRRIARGAMRVLARRPVGEALALLDEARLQRRGRVRLGQHRLAQRPDVEIDERDAQLREPARFAQQMPVHARLRPMQRALIGGHPVEIAAMRLDFLEAVQRRIVTVRAAAHREAAMLARQRDLLFVAGAAARYDRRVPGDALECARRGREAQIEIARARGEFAHRAHCDDVAHASASSPCDDARASPVHRTSSTRTGIRCRTQ